jgi:glycosyltransferase involved in cell wall biosynthesis
MLGWEFPPKIVGGLGVVFYHICKHLRKKGIDLTIVLPEDPENKEFNIVPVFRNVRVINVYSSWEFSEGKTFFEQVENYAKIVAKVCEKLSFDIIHAHDWLTFKAGILLKEKTGKPLIVHVHSTEFDRAGGKFGNPLVHAIEYESFHKADKIIAVSERVKNWIVKEYFVPPEKIKVIYNAIENPPRKIEKKKEEKVVLFCGRLSLMKGPEYFLLAAKKVLEKEDAKFVIVGKGELMHELMEKACELGIADKVLFTGFIDHKTLVNEVYKQVDIYVMPSISEPFGLTALEAVANNVPIIVSKQSGVAEVLKHCLKVDFWDVNELANKIIALLKYKPLKEMLKENSLEEVKKLTWEKQTDELIKVYEGVLKW